MSISILHLTDLHAGSKALADEDQKVSIPAAIRAKLIDRLAEYIRSLPQKPDYVVVSGDFTIHNDEEGYNQSKHMLLTLVEQEYLPPPERFLMVPGNHDVQRIEGNTEANNPLRYEKFLRIIGRAFPHAHVAGDPTLPAELPSLLAKDVPLFFGGLTTELRAGDVKILRSYPFLLDLEQDIFLFAFNSATASNISLPPNKNILATIESIRTLYPAISEAVSQLESLYLQSLLIDGGLIGELQLTYFQATLKSLKSTLGPDRFDALTKIAVLHHHVSHLWEQQLEVKAFESIIDASQLKQILLEYGFDIVLHGHKHTNHVALDASLIPLESGARFDPLVVVSGGTVGGHPRLNDHQTIKVLYLPEPRGPRTASIIQEIPLRQAGDTADAIRRESSIFTAPIGARLPDVHSLGGLKARLDSLVVERLSPELVGGTVNLADEIRLPLAGLGSAHVHERIEYRSYFINRHDSKLWFYDVILLSEKVSFQQRSRVYSFLAAVERFQKQSEGQCKVVVMFGNLERTHFGREQHKGAITRSVRHLYTWFKPALDSGFLTIRECPVEQGDLRDILTEEIASGALGS